jgi:hypothetical protein
MLPSTMTRAVVPRYAADPEALQWNRHPREAHGCGNPEVRVRCSGSSLFHFSSWSGQASPATASTPSAIVIFGDGQSPAPGHAAGRPVRFDGPCLSEEAATPPMLPGGGCHHYSTHAFALATRLARRSPSSPGFGSEIFMELLAQPL